MGEDRRQPLCIFEHMRRGCRLVRTKEGLTMELEAHGTCYICKELHHAMDLTKIPSGEHLCPLCYEEYLETKEDSEDLP